MKIGLLIKFGQEYIDRLKSELQEHEIVEIDASNIENAKLAVKDLDVIIGASVSKEILQSAENLKLFQVPWVGLDRVDFELLKNKNVLIANSKWNDRIVAEYALTLLLTLIKQIVPVHNIFQTGSWNVRFIQSKQLTNETVLLIGFGSIGREIAKMLKPFTSEVYALRNNPEKSTEEERNLVKRVIGWNEYLEIAQNASYVINSLPLTPNTENILNKERILGMKISSFFVNVGRGKTVDEQALFEALQSKHLAGAAIDVWYNYKGQNDTEPFFPSKFPFHELENVIMSPHRAATFVDTPETVWNDAIFNIKALAANNPLKNIIDYEKRY